MTQRYTKRTKQKKRNPNKDSFKNAGLPGFEPGLSDPESDVLPLYSIAQYRAGKGNRTLILGLEGRYTAIVLYPQNPLNRHGKHR